MQRFYRLPARLVCAVAIALILSLSAHMASIILTGYPHLAGPGDFQFPIRVQPAELVVAQTDRYTLYDDADWKSLTPPGAGFIRLPGTNQYAAVSLYHQLHCLNGLRKLIVSRNNLTDLQSGHANHCLSYLRQALLCHADTTLEPTKRIVQPDGHPSDVVTGFGVTHKCRDWAQIRQFMVDDYNEWKDLRL